jgi:hypothetical protein
VDRIGAVYASDVCQFRDNIILGHYPLIANCLSNGLRKDSIELEHYPSGNLLQYVDRNRGVIGEAGLRRWVKQMIESVAYIYFIGVTYADLRIDQWLVDARLSDFNGSTSERCATVKIHQVVD